METDYIVYLDNPVITVLIEEQTEYSVTIPNDVTIVYISSLLMET